MASRIGTRLVVIIRIKNQVKKYQYKSNTHESCGNARCEKSNISPEEWDKMSRRESHRRNVELTST